MIIIVDKNTIHSGSRRSQITRLIPLVGIDIFDITDDKRITMKSVQDANIIVVTDYATRMLRVLKHRFNEHLQDVVLPISELDRVIEDEIAFGVERWSEEEDD